MSASGETFLGQLQAHHKSVWFLIETAARDGLFVIDQELDAISPTNRLLLTCPSLHDIIATLVDDWAEGRFSHSEKLAELLRVALEYGDANS